TPAPDQCRHAASSAPAGAATVQRCLVIRTLASPVKRLAAPVRPGAAWAAIVAWLSFGSMTMTTTPSRAAVSPQDRARDKRIQRELLAISDDVRARHGWLRHQDAIGFAIFATSIAGCVLNAWLYIEGIMPAWLVIIGTAFWTSLLHELEHDLIHWMYFKQNKFVHHLMMAGVYLFRPFTANPWVRRHLHFHHHKVSGSATDLEERGITNGEKWGLRRLLMVGDNMLAVYLRANKYVLEPKRLYREGKVTREDLKNFRLISLVTYQPLGVISHTLWHGFILFHLANGVAWLA